MSNLNFLQNPARVFRCPKCGEEANTSLRECLFCHATFDPKVAEMAADVETKLDRALSDSEVVRMVGGAALSFSAIGTGLLLYTMQHRTNTDHEIADLARVHLLLGLAIASSGVFAVTAGLALRWFGRYGLLRFQEQLGAIAAKKMRTEYRQGAAKVLQGLGLGAVSLCVWIVYVLVNR